MLVLLINLLIVCVIIAVIWMIFRKIPIPPEMRWIVDIVLLVICLILVLSVLTGAWTFPIHALR